MEVLRRRCKAALLVLFILIVSTPLCSLAQEGGNDYEKEMELGEEVYGTRCMICHGSEGDGEGLVGIIRRAELSGRVMETYPRDFTLGVFRFRTTPTGCLPTDEDLLMIVENGIPRSFMPPHEEKLSDDEKNAVIEYVKEFSGRWEEEEVCDPITVVKPTWVGSPTSIQQGKKVYKKMKCWECHGYDGSGDGPKAEKLLDDWGQPIWPFNFTTGDLKRGSTPENIYITFTTGLDGTGMPSYEDSLNEEERWHLVSYTIKLMESRK
jgi:mono/diheme cytochrome c family protein